MKKFTQTLVFCFLAFNGYCQNWQVIPSGLDSITLTDDSIYYTATIDSVYSTPSEMSWVLNKKMLQFTSRIPNCDADLFQSAMGYKISQSNSTLSFYYYSDTFSFSMNTPSYCVFNGDSILITPLATVRDTLFNGQIDSIKNFSVTTLGNPSIFIPAVTYHLQLSKNYGLIEYPHIFNLAQLDIRYTLPGYTIKRIDTDYPSKKDIYNYEVNSQFHKREVWTSNGFLVKELLYNVEVLSKTTVSQSIEYRVFRKIHETGYSYFPYKDSSSYSEDTVTWVLTNFNQPLYSKVTDLQFDSDTNYSKFLTVKRNQLNQWEVTLHERDLAIFTKPCASMYLDVDQTKTIYRECFGEKYFFISDCDAGYCQTRERELLFAQNGSCTFGTPNYISSNEYRLKELEFYPNPVNNKLFLTTPVRTGTKWTISDYTGKIVSKGTLNKGDHSIDVSNLQSGMYNIVIDDYPAVKIIKK